MPFTIETAARSQMVGGRTFADQLDQTLEKIRKLLLEKNATYGNSALDPVRLFSQVDAAEQIRVRIDDKISRMIRGREYAGDDTAKDLLGYLILLDIAERLSVEREARNHAVAEIDVPSAFTVERG